MRNKLLLTLGLFVLIYACKHDIINPGNDSGNNGGGAGGGSADSFVCFEAQILPIFLSNCAKSGCHDVATAEEDLILDSYDNIIRTVGSDIKPGNANNSKLYKVLLESGDDRMPQPPNPPLLPEQIELIKEWINEGAKNTTGCAVSCDANVFTFSGAVKPIVTTYCIGCHSGATANGGVDLSTYSGVKTVADNGVLIKVINHAPNFPAMPQNGNKLNDCKIEQIQKWIDNGAQNN